VTEAHPELNVNLAIPTQFYSSGAIAFGRKAWPAGDPGEPCGLWIEDLRLEKLSAEDSPPPSGSLWIPTKIARTAKIDLVAARAEVIAAAKHFLTKEELTLCRMDDPDRNALVRFSLQIKKEFLEMFADGDGQRFVACLVTQFDLLARFIPVLNKILCK